MSPKKTPVYFLDLLKVIHVAMIKVKENVEKESVIFPGI